MRVQSNIDGSWPSNTSKEGWDDTNDFVKADKTDFMLMVGVSQEQAVVILAKGEGKVRVYYNLALVGTGSQVDVVGAFGSRAATTLRRLPPESFSTKTVIGRARNRIAIVPSAYKLLEASSARQFKSTEPGLQASAPRILGPHVATLGGG